MKNKKYFIAVLVLMLIVANVWCYLENDRLLKVGTNFVMLGLLIFVSLNSKKE